MDLKLETHVTDGITVVSCHGRIVLGEDSAALRDTLKQVLTSSREVVLNLSGVNYIDSSGLGTLIAVYSSARSAGADIKLAGLGYCRLRNWSRCSKFTITSSKPLPPSIVGQHELRLTVGQRIISRVPSAEENSSPLPVGA
jgi:anti-sigma B factor antagonist